MDGSVTHHTGAAVRADGAAVLADGMAGPGTSAATEAEPYPEPEAPKAHRRWNRVVVKLSGEAFSGNEPLGISPDVVFHLAKEIAAVVADGVNWPRWSGAATCSAASRWPSAASTGPGRTTWACWGP